MRFMCFWVSGPMILRAYELMHNYILHMLTRFCVYLLILTHALYLHRSQAYQQALRILVRAEFPHGCQRC